ncbi:MAG: UDP-N-acetylglucosamine 2-epimerase [Kiritimatiellae bacterium]|nr:UDP-N-acetylglucosamine 2-epimerase [Kiritimatiellia bacterium]
MTLRKTAVITVGRSDFGIYRPILRRIRQEPGLNLCLIAGGGHLDENTGYTIDQIRAEGWPIAAEFPMPLSADTPEATAHAMGTGIATLSAIYAREKPDLLLVLGDRYEMFAAVAAAVPFNLPVAHIHGGELTEGAMDDQFRHAITKMSHLHFTSTPDYARRVIQLGEAPWRVTISGAPALDNLNEINWLEKDELESALEIEFSAPPILVTFHPVIREAPPEEQIRTLLNALETRREPILFTYPNVDPGSSAIITAIRAFAAEHPQTRIFRNLGVQRYFSLMKIASAMVGNSSSGLIEAGSFALPVLNIGIRQDGRIRGPNVLDVPCHGDAIRQGLAQLLTPAFRTSIQGMANPYGNGKAADLIVERLKTVKLNEHLLRKRFFDLPEPKTGITSP